MMSQSQQVEAWKLDLLSDAESSEAQAVSGPFFPHLGVTAESLLAYAADCRRKASNPEKTLAVALKGSLANSF